MTQPSSPGLGLAFAVQSERGAPVTDHSDYHRVRVNTASLGIQQSIGRFPIEVGGTYHPGGEFKMFYAGAGMANWSPRLEGDMGYLLHALLGETQASGTSDADGAFTTSFNPVDDVSDHPWLSLRRLIPNDETADILGEYMYDAKLSGMSFTLGAGSPAVTDLAFLSIDAGHASDASDWVDGMDDEFETTESVILAPASGRPILGAMTGIDLGEGENEDAPIPTIGLQFGIANSFSADGIRPELVIGSYQPDDAVLLGQTASFQITYKWRDPRLYRAIYNHGHNAYQWSPRILSTDVDFVFRSPRYVGSSTSQYEQLTFSLADCTLQCPQGIVLSGGDFLTLNIVGTANAQQDPSDYLTATLINAHAYTDLGVSYS